MTQDDIRRHYELEWTPDPARPRERSYSTPVEDAIIYPALESMIRDHRLAADGGRVLDVGCGSGRWLRFFLDRFTPAELVGVDFAASAIRTLETWAMVKGDVRPTTIDLQVADITAEHPPAIGCFDLVTIMNVLFHIPESAKFDRALTNLRALVADDGRIVTTEYLPRREMRTEWMLVRSRYQFEARCKAAGLRIVDIRPCSFFANDPMGIDGTDDGARGHFMTVRAKIDALLRSGNPPEVHQFLVGLLADIERATISYCTDRIAPSEFPAQKLVVLAPA